jgi:hypothetical protein
MPVSDGDYKKRLAKRQQSMNASKREKGRAAHNPYEPTIEDKIRGGQFGRIDSKHMPMIMPPVAGVGMIAGEGAGMIAPLLSRISSPVIQRALNVAGMEGKQVGADILEEGAMQGVKYSQSGVTRAGKAGEDALFNFIGELERIGVKPATANRLLKGFSEYADDPAQAMMTLGENMARRPESGMSAKQALIERMLRNIGQAAEDNFLG